MTTTHVKTLTTVRYFLDTEFMEDGETIELISIGIVCEDGREFYAESYFDPNEANDWVKENVLPHLWHRQADLSQFNRWSQDPNHYGGLLYKSEIRRELQKFVRADEHRPQFWAYYGDYDWVALCQLFGTMVDLPKGWSMFAMDVKQLAVMLGDPQLPPQSSTEHNALDDARWTQEAHDWLLKGVEAGDLGYYT